MSINLSDTSFNLDNLNISESENNNQIGGFFSNPITPVINTVKIIMKNIADKQNNNPNIQPNEITGGDSEPDSLFNSEKTQETPIQNSKEKVSNKEEKEDEVVKKTEQTRSESKSNLPSSLIIRNFSELPKTQKPIENTFKKVNQEIPLADSVKTTEVFEDKITLQTLPELSSQTQNIQENNQDLQTGGSNYKTKYLKYKQKYLELKKSLRKID